MSQLISVNRITKSYGPKKLFTHLSFGIARGDRIGLVGPNGAGKSTLLKILARLDEPDTGEVFYSKGLRIGYLPQMPVFKSETIEQALLSVVEHPDDALQIARAEELISRLGLDQGTFQRQLNVLELSGGQQKKVALARELMKEPDLLLLDEPTNHLDIESLLWLEDYLMGLPSLTLLTVTHDRLFLQNVSEVIMDLDPQYKDGLLRIEGGYAEYLEARALRLNGQVAEESSRANDLRREMSWLMRGARARTTKAKARIKHTYDLQDEVAQLRALNHKRELVISLKTGEKTPKKLIEAKQISKSYGDKTLFQKLDLMLMAGSRIGLLGRNGCGKTTLIRCLLGEEGFDHGQIIRADRMSANYFAQTRDSLKSELSLIKNLNSEGEYVILGGKPVFAAGYLERFRFKKEQHLLPMKSLSGGEQARLLIAKLMLKEAPILVLDEPTNDLDIETLDILRESLKQFEGAVLLVTHDRFFMEQVCDTIIGFPEEEDLLPHETPGQLFKFESYLQWQDWKQNRQKLRTERLLKLKNEANAGKKNAVVKMSYNETRELEGIQPLILQKEATLGEVTQALSSPEHASNVAKLMELSHSAEVLEQEIATLYARWVELENKKVGS